MTDSDAELLLGPLAIPRKEHVSLLRLALAAYLGVDPEAVEVFPAALIRLAMESGEEGIVAHIIGIGPLVLYHEQLEEDELSDPA